MKELAVLGLVFLAVAMSPLSVYPEERRFSPEFNAGPYYNGPLFDAHFHMPVSFRYGGGGFRFPILGKDVALDEILGFFDKENVRGAIAFFIPNQSQLEKEIKNAAGIKKSSFDRLHLFLMPGYLDAERLDKIQGSNKGLFEGYGELAFYAPEQAGSSPDDERYSEIYKVAAGHGLVVMIHPDKDQRSNMERAFKDNPGVKFLVHGYEIEYEISSLMGKYPNVYFSVDSAVLYPMRGMFMFGPRERFVARFKKEFGAILKSKVRTWKRQIEKYPDRFMWGSDRGVDWHFNEEISALFEEFARAFIGKLDAAVQEKFAYKNAESLLE